ncbi:sensor histidine kinase [Hufsiella ginkgonis]|uniref:histidine kinase n=1 Tax=Hufsiella ginkgonis TaxID=2695274 RepID=A0A7K1XRZ1_9SPHI|nr:HAMP domain-containing protein [Hufsiella ginkgonis]MXV13755.1 HAMP domain-containing protein [Hufsiella ginkgonis]
MNWFQPEVSSIPNLSITCIDLVFLVYLLRLRNKTRDCYMVILLYLTAVPAALASVFIDFMTVAPTILYGVSFFLFGVHILSVIWCSYHFYKPSYPRESKVIMTVFIVLYGSASYLWLKDFAPDNDVNLDYILAFQVIISVSTLLAAINYLRKIKFFLQGRGPFSFIGELLHPSTREVAVFGGFALSLVLLTLIQVDNILVIFGIIPVTLYFLLSYLFSVSLTLLVAFAYFNYAHEQTSFETKLVGITLFLTLTVISIIVIILFGPLTTAATAPYIKMFVWIIPVSTLLIAIFLPMLLRLTLLRHLNKIVKGVQQVISGDLNTQVEVEVNDEVGRLSQNFNKMTGSLRLRTEQLNSMRETIATDFHDQTGNMLSAITRQAGLLKLKLNREHELQPIIQSIVENSNSLYASSKDFLWQLNHNGDDPNELFDYLTSYGQLYYNQFDIAFSAEAVACEGLKLDPSAALNLIFIFKEAMTNVVKHAGATEVGLTLSCGADQVTYLLEDNGSWKEADQSSDHYGLTNMERRCCKNNFGYTISKETTGTQISIAVPVHRLNGLS